VLKKLLKFLTLSFLALCLVFGFYAFQFYRFTQNPLPISEQGYVLTISPGTSVQKIAAILYKDKIIHHRTWFLVWVRWNDAFGKLKAGEYLVKPGTRLTELIQQMVEGRVIQYALTIVEGWTFERLMVEINQAPKLAHTLTGLKNEEIMKKIGHPLEHPEGRFLPETYYFPAGTSDVAFLQRAYQAMAKNLMQLWANRVSNLPLQSPYHALILASIIEKESCVVEEYQEIAGVYVRRLQKNMPLQADPTVIYGLGNTYTGRLFKEDLKKLTPYNTYAKVGLPPTPIAMPSLRSLEAALHPKAGETLYFVAKEDGRGHVFSKTLEEHNQAVLQYRNRKCIEGNN
jgi:UPF0755 protein